MGVRVRFLKGDLAMVQKNQRPSAAFGGLGALIFLNPSQITLQKAQHIH